MGYNEQGLKGSPLNQYQGRNYQGNAHYQKVMDEYSTMMGPEKNELYAGPGNIHIGERQRQLIRNNDFKQKYNTIDPLGVGASPQMPHSAKSPSDNYNPMVDHQNQVKNAAMPRVTSELNRPPGPEASDYQNYPAGVQGMPNNNSYNPVSHNIAQNQQQQMSNRNNLDNSFKASPNNYNGPIDFRKPDVRNQMM